MNIGVSNSYFSKMVKNNGSIGTEVLSKIVIYYDDLNIHWLLTGDGFMLKSSSDLIPTHNSSHPDHPQNSICKLCQEKDERILDLKSSIQDLKENINNLKEMNTGLNGILQSQQFVIQSLQDHIDDLQQPHLDAEESTPSRTG